MVNSIEGLYNINEYFNIPRRYRNTELKLELVRNIS